MGTSFRLELNGRAIEVNDLAASLEREVLRAAVEPANAALADLQCAIHGAAPTASIDELRNDLVIDGCCEEIVVRATARLAAHAEIESIHMEQGADTGEQLEEKPLVQPLAFISHASPDKERYVRALDEALRARGIRVWLDERDILPGDNIVDRIFDQGLGQSDIVVVVLSENTRNRPWVHEEDRRSGCAAHSR